MENKKPVGIVVVVLNCICAVVWNINVLLDLAYGSPNALRILCAVVWDICAVVWILRYCRSGKKE